MAILKVKYITGQLPEVMLFSCLPWVGALKRVVLGILNSQCLGTLPTFLRCDWPVFPNCHVHLTHFLHHITVTFIWTNSVSMKMEAVLFSETSKHIISSWWWTPKTAILWTSSNSHEYCTRIPNTLISLTVVTFHHTLANRSFHYACCIPLQNQ